MVVGVCNACVCVCVCVRVCVKRGLKVFNGTSVTTLQTIENKADAIPLAKLKKFHIQIGRSLLGQVRYQWLC